MHSPPGLNAVVAIGSACDRLPQILAAPTEPDLIRGGPAFRHLPVDADRRASRRGDQRVRPVGGKRLEPFGPSKKLPPYGFGAGA